MRKNKKIFPVPELGIYLQHIVIHLWTNSFTGSKKISRNKDFARHILIRNYFAILVNKCKRLNAADRRQPRFGKPRNDPGHGEVKAYNQYTKKNNIKNHLFAHTNGIEMQR